MELLVRKLCRSAVGRYLIPFYGLYKCMRDRNMANLKEDIEVIGTGSRFQATMIGLVPINIIEAIGIYKFVEHAYANSGFLSELWQGLEMVGEYGFFT